MAVAKKKTSKFIVRKSKKTGLKIKLYGGPMMKVLAAEKARSKTRKTKSVRVSAKSKRRAIKRNSAVKIIVRKNGKRIYGAAAKAVMAKRNAAKRNRKPGKIEQLLSVAGGDRVARAYDIVANPIYKKAVVERYSFDTGKTSKIKVVDAVKAIAKHDKVPATVARQMLMSSLVTAGPYNYKLTKTYSNPARRKRRTGKNPYLAIINPKKSKRRNATPKRRKRNGLYEEFHGEEARSMSNDLAPDGTPANVEMLGRLDVIYFQQGDEHIPKNGKTHSCIEFGKDGEERPKLVSNANGTRYFIVGNITQFAPVNSLFGKATRIEYTARKPHLEGHDKPVPYWHPLGEENGIRPTLETDHEGYLVLKGGDYRTTDAGIIN